MNTRFEKPNKNLCTYTDMDNTTGGAPWNADRYAQIDYILINSKWRNVIKNVES